MNLKTMIEKLFGKEAVPENGRYDTEQEYYPTAEEFIEEYTKIGYLPGRRSPVDSHTILRGICLGDIFGMPYEGWGLPDGEDPDTVNPLLNPTAAFTDDTVMTIAVADALLERADNHGIYHVHAEMGKKISQCRVRR